MKYCIPKKLSLAYTYNSYNLFVKKYFVINKILCNLLENILLLKLVIFASSLILSQMTHLLFGVVYAYVCYIIH